MWSTSLDRTTSLRRRRRVARGRRPRRVPLWGFRSAFSGLTGNVLTGPLHGLLIEARKLAMVGGFRAATEFSTATSAWSISSLTRGRAGSSGSRAAPRSSRSCWCRTAAPPPSSRGACAGPAAEHACSCACSSRVAMYTPCITRTRRSGSIPRRAPARSRGARTMVSLRSRSIPTPSTGTIPGGTRTFSTRKGARVGWTTSRTWHRPVFLLGTSPARAPS